MDHPRHIAIGDQANPHADGAQAGDDFGMSRPVQDAGGDFGRSDSLDLGQGFHVVRRRGVQVDDPGRISGTDGDLVHVGVWRLQHRPGRRPGHHRQRVGHGLGGQGGAFQGIERDIDPGPLLRAHLLADVQHRRLIPFAFADDHQAVDVQIIQGGAHGVHGCLVGGLLVAASDHLPGRDGRSFGGPDRVQN